MKKVFFGLFFLVVAVFLIGCKEVNYIYAYPDLELIVTDDPYKNYLITKVGSFFTVNYDFIYPINYEVDITVSFSDDELFDLISIDTEKRSFIVYSKTIGIGTICVKTDEYFSSTSLPIHIN